MARLGSRLCSLKCCRQIIADGAKGRRDKCSTGTRAARIAQFRVADRSSAKTLLSRLATSPTADVFPMIAVIRPPIASHEFVDDDPIAARICARCPGSGGREVTEKPVGPRSSLSDHPAPSMTFRPLHRRLNAAESPYLHLRPYEIAAWPTTPDCDLVRCLCRAAASGSVPCVRRCGSSPKRATAGRRAGTPARTRHRAPFAALPGTPSRSRSAGAVCS